MDLSTKGTLGDLLRYLEEKYGPRETWTSIGSDGPRPALWSCPTCQDTGWTASSAPYGSTDFGRAVACTACPQGAEQLWAISGISTPERTRCSFAGFTVSRNPAMRVPASRAEAWAAGDGPPFLVLTGPRGVGKTHLALAAAATCIERRRLRTAYEIVPRFLNELWAAQQPSAERTPEEILRRAAIMPVLILDELGKDSGADWAARQVRELINERWRHERPTVITSNVDPDAWDGDTRSRLFDRRLSWVLPCRGTDLRIGDYDAPR